MRPIDIHDPCRLVHPFGCRTRSACRSGVNRKRTIPQFARQNFLRTAAVSRDRCNSKGVAGVPAQLLSVSSYLPKAKPANVANAFYWAKVKFGLKPTLRVVHVITMKAASSDPILYVIAEKQLYSGRYFENCAGSLVLRSWHRRYEKAKLLSDHAHGIRASRSHWSEGLN